jgi:hypothetical protein
MRTHARTHAYTHARTHAYARTRRFQHALNLAGPIPDEHARNLTVFHVNPDIYGVAPINMNTADVLGDMYFDMRSKALPIECASNSSAAARDCDNAEVVATDLVITKLVLEVDDRFGMYGRCNVCVNGSDHHGNNSCTDGVYDCSCAQGGSSHSVPCGAAVGLENITTHVAGRQCGQSDPNWSCWYATPCAVIREPLSYN